MKINAIISIHSTYFKMKSSIVPSIVGEASFLLFTDELYLKWSEKKKLVG